MSLAWFLNSTEALCCWAEVWLDLLGPPVFWDAHGRIQLWIPQCCVFRWSLWGLWGRYPGCYCSVSKSRMNKTAFLTAPRSLLLICHNPSSPWTCRRWGLCVPVSHLPKSNSCRFSCTELAAKPPPFLYMQLPLGWSSSLKKCMFYKCMKEKKMKWGSGHC